MERHSAIRPTVASGLFFRTGRLEHIEFSTVSTAVGPGGGRVVAPEHEGLRPRGIVRTGVGSVATSDPSEGASGQGHSHRCLDWAWEHTTEGFTPGPGDAGGVPPEGFRHRTIPAPGHSADPRPCGRLQVF